jgi:RimJ/RimL family protein N-acetyltransferase
VSEAPHIETERLTLDGHRLEDFTDCLAMWTEPEVTRFIGGKPSTEQEVWFRLLRYVGHWSIEGFGFWVAREKTSGRFVGEVGFAEQKRGIEQAGQGPELGYALAPWCHGRGLATEAVRAVVAWGDAHFPERRTWCLINPEAKASIGVAEKCGYREFARAPLFGSQVILLKRVAAPA